MKRFNITVNGNAYDVAVEEVKGNAAPVVKSIAPAAPQATPAPAPAPVAPAPIAAPAGAISIKAPMPGTILDIKCAVGDTVKEGQPVFVLEAMKMENDIVAIANGKIVAINVKKGDTVNSDDVLASIQ